MERKKEAIEVYAAALRANPGFADCHYNLALLCESSTCLAKPSGTWRSTAS
jgi:hypothetical protein